MRGQNSKSLVMQRITMLLLGIVVLRVAVSNARGADMAYPPPPTANPPPRFYAPAAFSWTGFYLGGNFGWDWTNFSNTITIAGVGSGPIAANVRGFLGGGQAGFNWQIFQPVVVGLEADFQGAQAASGSRSVNGTVGPATITAISNTPYFGTVRGRIGYAYGTLLFYATAGGLFGDNTLKGTVSNTRFSSSATFWTWTAGAGIEASLGGHFSIKLEYLFAGSPSEMPVVPGQSASAVRSSTNLIRVGLNYRF